MTCFELLGSLEYMVGNSKDAIVLEEDKFNRKGIVYVLNPYCAYVKAVIIVVIVLATHWNRCDPSKNAQCIHPRHGKNAHFPSR